MRVVTHSVTTEPEFSGRMFPCSKLRYFHPKHHLRAPVQSMMNQVYNTLPDDRPITSLHVVEDGERCPKGYIPILKTYDQDSDADLWKETGFFGRKCTRYLCISKTEGMHDFVVESLIIIGEKEVPPQGYKTIGRTFDSDQKAWRKRQLCYKFNRISASQAAVTDIIVLSRMKKAPEEFTLLGDINGMTLCYKMSRAMISNNMSLYPQVPYPVLPYQPNSIPENKAKHNSDNGPDILRPFRPAPKPPTSAYATMSGYNGLEGVPFILNPKFSLSNETSKDLAIPKIKTKSQIDEEYRYEFRTEREA